MQHGGSGRSLVVSSAANAVPCRQPLIPRHAWQEIIQEHVRTPTQLRLCRRRLVRVISYFVGLWNVHMQLNHGLFAAVSLQKSVRDRRDGIVVTGLYFGLCWLSVVLALVLLIVRLWYAILPWSEKWFHGMAYLMSLFAAVAVQKNVRDTGSVLQFPAIKLDKSPHPRRQLA